MNAALKGLARLSLGEWLRFLRECLKLTSERDRSHPAAGALAALFFEKTERWSESLVLFNEIRAFLRSAPSTKEALSLEMLFAEVVSYRNKTIGHGAAQSAELYQRFGERFGSAFQEILDRSPFLTACRLVSFDSIQVEEGSRVECGVVEYMRSNPVRRSQALVLAYGERAPRKGGPAPPLRRDGPPRPRPAPHRPR